MDVPQPTATHKFEPLYATPKPLLSKIPVFPPLPIQLIPSVDDAIELDVPEPTATHKLEPTPSFPNDTPCPVVSKIVIPLPIQVTPSVDVAIELFVPCPTATNKSEPLYVIPLPTLKIVVPLPLHDVPSNDVAIVEVPSPTATQLGNETEPILPDATIVVPLVFVASELPEYIVRLPKPVQVVPLVLYAIVFEEPEPTAT